MASPDLCERDVTATAALHPTIGQHWVKRLARRMRVPCETARHWIYRGVPDSRLPEIREAILAECDEIEALLAATRRRWKGERNHAAIGALARGGTYEAGAPTRRMGSQGGSEMTEPPS